MSAATHTPGPWNVGTSAQGREVVFLNGLTERHGGLGPSQNWIDCNTEANASLIAAAPELLEACVAMIEWDAREEDHAVDFHARMMLCKAAFQKARAAIAKAEGRS